MTKRQVIIIICIIIAPVIVGMFIASNTATGNSRHFNLGYQCRKIGLVRIFDIIYSSENYIKQLKELRKDKSIAGVILRIDSPGGAVAPSQEIYEEIMQYRKDNKPLIVSMGNVAASGGYYIASPATKIFANPGTITGSLGVIFQFPHYYELLNKIGIKMTTIKAGEYKDIGNPNRDLSEKEKNFLQQLISNTHERFIEDVTRARNMDSEDVRKIADGRIFTGQQAFDIGLIDSLGGFNTALSFLKDTLNLPEKTKVIEKSKYPSFFRNFLNSAIIKHFKFLNNSHIPAGSYFLLENF